MNNATSFLLLSSAIASFGAGWIVRDILGRTRSPQKVSQSLRSEHSSDASTSLSGKNTDSTTATDQLAHALLQQAPVGYLEVDEENQLLWSNTLACQMLGIPTDKTDNPKSPRLLLELVRSYELDELIENTRQTRIPGQIEWTLNLVSTDPVNPNEGVARPLRGYGVPLSNHHVGVFLENRQEAETLIQQRDRWTSDVAHELKTPLTSIRLVTETLRDRVDPSLTKWLDRLLNEILRLGNLVEDLLNLSRLQRSGGTGLTLKPVELKRLLLAVWQSLEPLAQIKHIQIAYDGPPNLIVSLDETLMHRVLINLMDNAIKYSPHEGTITVQANFSAMETKDYSENQPSQALIIDVIDEGSGFHKNDLPYIFNRFYRADPARSRPVSDIDISAPEDGGQSPKGPRNSGTGLGLAIVQQIVEAHGGRAQARNHPDTGGGWLTISIPTQPLSLEAIVLSQDKITTS
ncbi:MAG: PAS domain-containing sensor histidine kinase [Cyanobacteria bacterium J06626_14]